MGCHTCPPMYYATGSGNSKCSRCPAAKHTSEWVWGTNVCKDDRKCFGKVCTCTNGTGAKGPACPRHGGERCSGCKGGYTLSGGKCKKKPPAGGGLKPGSVVALKGGRGGKWCADEGHRVVCNRGHTLQWEKFTVVAASGGRVGLRGGKTGKMCADEDNRITCNRGHLLQWETFTVKNAGGGRIALQGGKGHKFCADEGGGVKCNRGWVRQWEKFSVKCMAGCRL